MIPIQFQMIETYVDQSSGSFCDFTIFFYLTFTVLCAITTDDILMIFFKHDKLH